MRERKGSGFGKRSVASESRQAIKNIFYYMKDQIQKYYILMQ